MQYTAALNRCATVCDTMRPSVANEAFLIDLHITSFSAISTAVYCCACVFVYALTYLFYLSNNLSLTAFFVFSHFTDPLPYMAELE